MHIKCDGSNTLNVENHGKDRREKFISIQPTFMHHAISFTNSSMTLTVWQFEIKPPLDHQKTRFKINNHKVISLYFILLTYNLINLPIAMRLLKIVSKANFYNIEMKWREINCLSEFSIFNCLAKNPEVALVEVVTL